MHVYCRRQSGMWRKRNERFFTCFSGCWLGSRELRVTVWRHWRRHVGSSEGECPGFAALPVAVAAAAAAWCAACCLLVCLSGAVAIAVSGRH